MNLGWRITLSLLGALSAVGLAACAGWLVSVIVGRRHETSSGHSGPLLWLERRSRRFWVAATTLPMLYLASFGPACWISSRVQRDCRFVNAVYPQLLVLVWHWDRLGLGPLEPGKLLFRYATAGDTPGIGVGPDAYGKIRIRYGTQLAGE